MNRHRFFRRDVEEQVMLLGQALEKLCAEDRSAAVCTLLMELFEVSGVCLAAVFGVHPSSIVRWHQFALLRLRELIEVELDAMEVARPSRRSIA